MKTLKDVKVGETVTVVKLHGNLDVHSHSLLSVLAKANLWRKE